MGEFADIKRKKFLQLLKKISKNKNFDINCGGNHQWKISHQTFKRPYPIPFKRNKVKGVYLKEIIKLIAKTGEFTEDELKEMI